MDNFKVGLLGTGNMAAHTADEIKKADGIIAYAVASRNYETAVKFAKEHGCTKAYGSYEELACDPQINLVYIATPQAFHYEEMKMCILHGKNILCEKPFTLNENQAKEIFKLAEQKQVFVAEALWCRYIPMAKKIKEFLSSGIIGEIQHLDIQLCYNVWSNPRISSLESGGGAILECGVYGINFISLVFGSEIKRILANAVFDERTHTDKRETVILDYGNNHDAVLYCTAENTGDRTATVYGTAGYAVIDHVNIYDRLSVFDTKHNLISSFCSEPDCSGICCEFTEARNCIKNGKIQSESSPFQMTESVLSIIDRIRDSIGLEYPEERQE